jgi:magnesium transporter
MSTFSETLQAHYYLALFVPIILGLSGNVGTQSATVTVRALAVGLISHSERGWAVVSREIRIGLAFGLLYGAVIGLIGGAFSGSVGYGLVIGTSLATGIIFANGLGTSIPMLLSRVGVDPAVATGPLVTTCVDMAGIGTYFTIAKLFEPYLEHVA